MPRTSFRTSTALVASLSLILPQGLFVLPARAQEMALFCLDGAAPPCPEGQPTEGTLMTPKQAEEAAKAAAKAQADADAQAQADAEAAAKAQAKTDAITQAQAEADAAAKAQAEADAATQAQVDADAAAQAQADADAAAKAQADADAAAKAQAEADAAAQAQADADAAAKAQADADAAAQAQADADAAAQAQSVADAAAKAQAEADAAAQVQADADAAAQAQVDADAAAKAQAEADAAAQAQAEADAAAQMQADAEAAAQAQATADAAAKAEADAAAATAQGAAADVSTETPVIAPDTPTSRAEDAAAAAAAAALLLQGVDPTVDTSVPPPAAAATADEAPSATDAGTTVTEQTVTTDQVRTSQQDFTTTVAGRTNNAADAAPDTAAPAAVAQPGTRGLSDLEKVLLIGLGAVVVGAVLSNGDQVVANSGDRVVTRGPTGYTVYKDDDALLRQPGTQIRTETFNDGSTRSVLTQPNGDRVVTIRDDRSRVLRRTRILSDGTQILLFDDLATVTPVDVRRLPPLHDRTISAASDRDILRTTFDSTDPVTRTFSLRQIREIPQVRDLAPGIDLDTINFATGSAAIPLEGAQSLVRVGLLMEDLLRANPREVFLIEGHTDATGSETFNLALSDRRAESVALALTETFNIPPENLVVQGYGEAFLKIDTQAAEQANRRATIRRITSLLSQTAAQ